jgi:hypothetical protein
MLITFKDKRGAFRHRTLTRTNVRKVAASIQRAHPGHALSHTVAILQQCLRDGKERIVLECSCESLPESYGFTNSP